MGLHELLDKVRWKLAQRHARPGRYDAARFWDARAGELIRTYDSPGSWQARGWMADGAEERLVPEWLNELGCSSVLVAGAGTGRQYAYLLAAGRSVEGFDLSAKLVEECRRRYPAVRTERASVSEADRHHAQHDAVLTSAVLQHVPPDEIAQALAVVGGLARKALIVRELTRFDADSGYQWAHDYRTLLAGWEQVKGVVTDERDGVTVELLAFSPPPAG